MGAGHLDAGRRRSEIAVMTQEQLSAALEALSVKTDKAGWSTLPDGRTFTLYAAHDGAPLTIGRVEAVAGKNGLLRARTAKGELYALPVEGLFAVAAEATPAQARKPGFA
jgi:hypothetical protein